MKYLALVSLIMALPVTAAGSPPSPPPWPCGTLTYSFLNGTPEIYNDDEKISIRAALDTWEEAIHIEFVEVANGTPADIEFRWILDPSLPPYSWYARNSNVGAGARIEFNERWLWTTSWQSSAFGYIVDLQTISTHYIGRVLGALINNDSTSVMQPGYTGSKRDLNLKDKDNIRTKYALCSNFGYYHSGSRDTILAPDYTSPWSIDSTDIYLVGDFRGLGHSSLLGIKPGHRSTLMSDVYSFGWGTDLKTGVYFSAQWTLRSDDLYVTGDFDGDGQDEILAANPDGNYQTLTFFNGPNQDWWEPMQSASNGDIDSSDKLIRGDFDGDGKDEVLLVKADASYYTMKFNPVAGSTTWNWDIIESGQGSIHWWVISTVDRYTAGDFDGDGRAELLAINPSSGWQHTIGFDNGQWQWQQGNGGNGQVGGANIGAYDRYISDDFDGDGRDEIILTNSHHPWSLRLGFNNGQWQALGHNQGNNYIGNWLTAVGDLFANGDFDGDGEVELMMLNGNGLWQRVSF